MRTTGEHLLYTRSSHTLTAALGESEGIVVRGAERVGNILGGASLCFFLITVGVIKKERIKRRLLKDQHSRQQGLEVDGIAAGDAFPCRNRSRHDTHEMWEGRGVRLMRVQVALAPGEEGKLF